MKSAKNVVVFARPNERRNKEELAFLPAALEIVETPASPISPGRISAKSTSSRRRRARSFRPAARR